VLKVRVNVNGANSRVDSHKKSGVQLLMVHVPDVVECWSKPAHTHSTVALTGIVVTNVPLTSSTKLIPGPTATWRFGFGVGVAPVGVTVGVAVFEGVRVAVEV
jgi:hypothetical protein